MFKKFTLVKSTLAAVLLSSATASAIPNGGGIYDVWAGSAWFDSGQGIVVTAGSYSSCMTKLANAINYRTSNWGWTVTENNGCKKSKYKSFTQLSMAQLEKDHGIDEFKEKVEEVKFRKQIEADEEIQALEIEYRVEEFRAMVEAQSGEGK